MSKLPCRFELVFGAVCGFTFMVICFSGVEPQQEGHPSLRSTPTVFRMWENISSMPVPAEKWKRAGFVVRDFSHDSAEELVASAGLGAVWNSLPHYASKADLFRLVAISKFGGWYADADIVPLSQISFLGERYKLVLFNEACGFMWFNKFKRFVGLSTITRAPQYRNSLFAAPKNWRPLRAAILMLESNVLNVPQPWSVPDVIEATGPGLLTKAVSLFPEDLKQATIVSCAAQSKQLKHLGLRTWHK